MLVHTGKEQQEKAQEREAQQGKLACVPELCSKGSCHVSNAKAMGLLDGTCRALIPALALVAALHQVAVTLAAAPLQKTQKGTNASVPGTMMTATRSSAVTRGTGTDDPCLPWFMRRSHS
jgi:hypothetical protein